jgi:hypothetical protein
MRESTLRTADNTLVAMLALLAALALVGTTWLMAYRSDRIVDRQLELVDAVERLDELAGADAVDCGRVSRFDEADAAIACVETAIRGNRSFKILREHSFARDLGMEWHWHGFTRNARGRQYMVSFMPRDATGPEAYLTVKPCVHLHSRLDNGDPGPACAFVDGDVHYRYPQFWYRSPRGPGGSP